MVCSHRRATAAAIGSLLLLCCRTLAQDSCTQERVAECTNVFTSAAQCGREEAESGLCDAETGGCRSRVAYALCLRSLDCDVQMYEMHLADCRAGGTVDITLHMSSSSMRGGAGMRRLYRGVDPVQNASGWHWDRVLTAGERSKMRRAVTSLLDVEAKRSRRSDSNSGSGSALGQRSEVGQSCDGHVHVLLLHTENGDIFKVEADLEVGASTEAAPTGTRAGDVSNVKNRTATTAIAANGADEVDADVEAGTNACGGATTFGFCTPPSSLGDSSSTSSSGSLRSLDRLLHRLAVTNGTAVAGEMRMTGTHTDAKPMSAIQLAQLTIQILGWCEVRRSATAAADQARKARDSVVVVPPLACESEKSSRCDDLVTAVVRTTGRPQLAGAVASALREGLKVVVVADGPAAAARARALLASPAAQRAHPALVGAQQEGIVELVELGRTWGFYGSVAANAGAYLSTTPFVAFVDDDDELAVGAGELIRQRLTAQPEIDIWIPSIRYTDGRVHCSKDCGMFDVAGGSHTARIERADPTAHARCMQRRGIVESNVCVPLYRTSLFAAVPFTHRVLVQPDEPSIFMGGKLLPHSVYLVDYHHVRACSEHGAKVGWLSTEEHAIYLVRPHTDGFHGSESAMGLELKVKDAAAH